MENNSKIVRDWRRCLVEIRAILFIQNLITQIKANWIMRWKRIKRSKRRRMRGASSARVKIKKSNKSQREYLKE